MDKIKALINKNHINKDELIHAKLLAKRAELEKNNVISYETILNHNGKTLDKAYETYFKGNDKKLDESE